MAETQKPGQSVGTQSDDWQHDLNPNPMAGQNIGLDASEAEKNAPTARNMKEVQRFLEGYSKDQLEQIPILPPGSRLKQGATYINLATPECQEFTAMGGMEAGPDDLYVPKNEVDYALWNQLTGGQTLDR